MIRSKDFALQGAGYFGMQATQVSIPGFFDTNNCLNLCHRMKPFTIGLALNDSPMGA